MDSVDQIILENYKILFCPIDSSLKKNIKNNNYT